MRFSVLYLDMNSFFASVEQHLDPSIRNRPVAITATEGEHGACVAASYEAKAYGVKTGTRVRDAKALCPGIVFLPSRHRLYVRYNLKVAEVLDRHAELYRIRSVDEFQIALSGEATELPGLTRLVTDMKAAVAREIGPCLRFSAGAGPNHLLAKIAGKLEKPDGFRWLDRENMPQAIAHLALDDLPGISSGMSERLNRAGIRDMAALCALDPRHARRIWNSVEGERFVRALQCEDIPLTETRSGGIGQSKILAPDFRAPREAYLVSRWLIAKAGRRLREAGKVAARFGLSIRMIDGRQFSRSMKCEARQDDLHFLRINRALWRLAWPDVARAQILSVGIQLDDTAPLSARNGDLLSGLGPAERLPAERAARAMDLINARFGDGTIRTGVNRPHPGFFERG
ncbi:hypothetical protein ACEUZ9_001088 [Paracoccus litorisediminis]|uniref:DNA polymerase Y family protein n=1 Tax=Paracoccus litorisediminis TaxID=2006130 RepID=UPI003731DBDD